MTLFNQRHSQKYYFTYLLGICLIIPKNYHLNTIHILHCFVLDFSTNMVNPCGNNTLYCLPQEYIYSNVLRPYCVG